MVGVALFGAGRIGRLHARNLVGHPRARLLAVYDVVEDAKREVAAETGARPAASVEEAMGVPGVEAVVIATSTDTHVDLIVKAVEAGKAVFCEKPIDLDLARVAACWRAIAPLEPLVQIGFNRRFDPSFAELKARLARGELGRLWQLIITSRDPDLPPRPYLERSGGLFRDMTIHDFDLARFLLPEEPVEVAAVAGALVEPGLQSLGDHDTAMVLLRTAGGIQVCITNCRRAAYGYDQRVEAMGERGALLVGNPRPHTVERWDAAATEARATLMPFFLERYAESYRLELDAFLRAVERREPVPVGFADGWRALLLAQAAYEALARGGWVRVEEVAAPFGQFS